MIGILKGIHRRVLGISKDENVISKNAYVTTGDRGSVVLPGSNETVAIFDDFVRDTGGIVATDPVWHFVQGDTGASHTITTPNVTNGVARLTLSATNNHAAGATAAFGVGIAQGLNWKVNSGRGGKNGLRLSARVKSDTWTDTGTRAAIWIGFTDTMASEAPVFDTGGAVISVATDAVGFFMHPGADTGWSAYAVQADTDATPVALDNTRTKNGANSNSYDTLEMEINYPANDVDTGGDCRATFWVNGVPKGSIDRAVTKTVALTPYVYLFGDTGGQATLDVDYLNVSAPRDTGT